MEDHKFSLKSEHVDDFIYENKKFDISVSRITDQASKTLSENLGIHIGYDFLFGLAYGIASQILSFIAYLMVPPFQAGWYVFTYKKIRGLPVEFNTLIQGFNNSGSLILYGLIFGFFQLFFLLLIGILAFVFVDLGRHDTLFNEDSPEFVGSMFLLIFIYFLGCLLFNIFTFFTPFFIVFSNMKIGEALTKSYRIASHNFGTLLKINLFYFVIQLVGTLFCLVGRLITSPISHISYHLIFEEIFDLDKELDETDEIIQHLI